MQIGHIVLMILGSVLLGVVSFCLYRANKALNDFYNELINKEKR